MPDNSVFKNKNLYIIFGVTLIAMMGVITSYSIHYTKLYDGLDKDLANSAWLFTTGMQVVIVPILSLVIL